LIQPFLRPRNDDKSRTASSQYSSTSVITPFQLRYETDIRNDEEMRIASSLYFSDKRHHTFSVAVRNEYSQ
jgi:hypothetical protein